MVVFPLKKNYSGDEIIVVIGDVCSRMGRLNNDTWARNYKTFSMLSSAQLSMEF